MNGSNIIHQLTSQSHSQMMSYVIETADNKLIVIDGGRDCDLEYLLSFIRKIRMNAGLGEDIYVDAWFLTHAHDDHVGAFIKLYENESDFKIEKVYYNFPTVEMTKKYEPSETYTGDDFNAILPKFASKTHILKKGDVIEIGTAEVRVLYSPDFTLTKNFINNTSVVFMVEIASEKILFLGDLGVEGGRVLLADWGDKLKADFVQMAHHGQNGVEQDVYQAISPSACLWDTPTWLWNNDAGNGFNTHVWKTVIVRGWMDELDIKEHYRTSEGKTNSITLPRFKQISK